jgi:2-dehydropantoate 2-reductase
MARIAIVGVGAVGGVVAASLEQAGHEVVLCTRKPLAGAQSGLVVETTDGIVTVNGMNIVDPDDAPAVDWVLVATKAYDAASSSTWLQRMCSDGTPLAVLQNGVEHRERFEPYVSSETILPVIVDCPVERLSPTKMRQRGPMSLKVPENEIGRSFVGLFAGSSVDAITVSDFLSVAWKKLCHNAVGVLPALVLQPSGIMRGEAMGEVARQMVRECIAVGRAEGAQLENAIIETVLEAYRTSPADSINSLHADRLAGRSMEIDARNGVVVRMGKKHGIPTPNNQMAVVVLETLVQRNGRL